MTTFGGSVQCLWCRATLLDDTERHPAGAALNTDMLYRATYARRRDGSLGLRLALATPDPVALQFLVGGTIDYADNDDIVGWTCPPVIPPTRMAIDLWSVNAVNGGVAGYYRWSAPECSPVFYAGSSLDGDSMAAFRAATTVDLTAGFHITVEQQLPEAERGVTLPEAVTV